jgi:hypothetical protein
MKIKARDVKVFFKSAAVTALVIICFIGAYLGCCKTYEEMRKNLFDDHRSAVIIGREYIKFFDKEIYF